MAPKKKSSKSKSGSSVKVANKKLNKYAKQGKLRKLRQKHKKKELKQKHHQIVDASPTTNGNEDIGEEEIPLQEEDFSYFGSNVDGNSFISSVIKREQKKRHRDGNDGEAHFEKVPRRWLGGDEEEEKLLLPIKVEGKVIPQVMKLKDSIEEKDNDSVKQIEETGDKEDMDVEKKPATPLPLLSSAEIFAIRKKKLAERKEKIAELASAVVQNPEESMGKLKELRSMLGEADPDVCLTVRKLVMVSICEVLKDIIPGYRLRMPSAKEKEQRMKQETKKLMDFEAALLLSYKTYLEFLEITAKRKTFGNSYRAKRLGFVDISLPQSSLQDLSEVAVWCLCELLVTHPHFNYRSEVISFLVPFMNRKNPKHSDVVCNVVKQIFRTDRGGDVSLEIVRAITKMVKNVGTDVQPKVLETFMALKIKEVNTEAIDGIKKMKRKEKFQKFSRRERKHLKQKEDLEKELQETRASEDRQKRLQMNTEIVQMVFLTFFRILKQDIKSSLLPVVLEGLAKFSHLINIEFFHDLFVVFNQLIDSGELTHRETLHCIQTAFTILSGQGAALNIDPTCFYTHMYQVLLNIHAGNSPEDAGLILDCVDVMIMRRKKQMNQQRVLAYIKRLTTMCLQHLPEAVCGFLAGTRCLISMFPYADVLFDQEAESSGVYMPYLTQPEHCNANSTALWELYALRKHFHPEVRKFASSVLYAFSASSRGHVSADLTKKTPSEVFSFFLKKEFFDPNLPTKPSNKTKKIVSDFRNEDFRQYLCKHLGQQA